MRTATRFLFLRHGATDYPAGRYYCDSKEDPPLNPSGLTQAEAWVGHFNPDSFKAIYTSPSRRTRETARIATQGVGLEPMILDGLMERSFGVWDGLNSGEIKERFPEEWSAYREDPLLFIPTGGESLQNFLERVNKTLQPLLERHAGQTVLIVAHVGTIRMALVSALGLPLENLKRLVVRYCSVTEIEYTDDWPNLISFSKEAGVKSEGLG